MVDAFLEIVKVIFLGSVSIVTGTFGLYGIFLLMFSLKGRALKRAFNKSINPYVSIILPTFNEGSYIRKKIKNILNTTYDQDKIEIIIADDSTDEMSKEEIAIMAKKYPNVKVIQSSKRRGYSKALIDGFNISTGEIIIITDCGSLYEPKTIKELITPFDDPKIGGVTGEAFIINQNEHQGKSEAFYRNIYNFMRKSESNADSTFHFHGEVSAVRKKLLEQLPWFPTNLDIAIAFHIRKQGYKVFFNPKAKFIEYAPDKFKDRIKQKSLRAAGLILVLFGYRGMLSPQYGLFGLIIYPAHFSMMILCPVSIISGFSSFLLLLTVEHPGSIVLFALVILGFLIIITIVKKELITNLIQLEVALLKGLWQAVRNNEEILHIEKIESTRRT